MTESDERSLALKAETNTSPDNSSEVSKPINAIDQEEVNALVSEYEARLDEIADLITRVRHEINNPLTGVLGQAQLLLREDLSQTARRRAQTIEELAIRIRDTVAQLRQVQKPARTVKP